MPKGATTSVPVAVGDDHSRTVAVDLFASRPLITGHRRGALVIEAGSPDFVKYIDGGVRGDWRRGVTISSDAGEVVASAVRGLAAEVYFPLDKDIGGVGLNGDTLTIRFRAKAAVKKQLVSIFLNEHKLTDLRMPTTDWETYSIQAGSSSWVAGENKLRFYFRTAGEFAGEPSAAAFSQFVIGASMASEPAFVTALGHGVSGDAAGLSVNAESRLSYYLQLPEAASELAFEVVTKGRASVRVRKTGESTSREIWSGGAAIANVDLGALRGEVVRLDLLSDGPAVWLRPALTVEPVVAEVARDELARADRIILWSVSSLRSDVLRSRAGRGFQRFLDNAFVVPEMQSTTPLAGGANASLMLGRFKTRGRIDAPRVTLAERLEKAGFTTALISGNGFVSDVAGFSQGYGHYDNPMRRQHHFGAKTLWRQAKKFVLSRRTDRLFIHIATVEGHVPYRPSSESLERYWQLPAPFAPAKTLDLATQLTGGRRTATETERGYVRALYNGAMQDSAAAFSTMLEELEELQLQGNTVIVLVGEHGEELWERGTFGHGSSLFQESLATPLAISGAGIQHRKVPRRVSMIDVAPTILDLAGVGRDTNMQGLSVLGNPLDLEARPVFSGLRDGSRAVRLGRYKLVNASQVNPALFDLVADHDEQRDLALANPVAVRALRITLSAFVAFENEWSTARWGQPSAPIEAFARDLGF